MLIYVNDISFLSILIKTPATLGNNIPVSQTWIRGYNIHSNIQYTNSEQLSVVHPNYCLLSGKSNLYYGAHQSLRIQNALRFGTSKCSSNKSLSPVGKTEPLLRSAARWQRHRLGFKPLCPPCSEITGNRFRQRIKDAIYGMGDIHHKMKISPKAQKKTRAQ